MKIDSRKKAKIALAMIPLVLAGCGIGGSNIGRNARRIASEKEQSRIETKYPVSSISILNEDLFCIGGRTSSKGSKAFQDHLSIYRSGKGGFALVGSINSLATANGNRASAGSMNMRGKAIVFGDKLLVFASEAAWKARKPNSESRDYVVYQKSLETNQAPTSISKPIRSSSVAIAVPSSSPTENTSVYLYDGNSDFTAKNISVSGSATTVRIAESSQPALQQAYNNAGPIALLTGSLDGSVLTVSTTSQRNAPDWKDYYDLIAPSQGYGANALPVATWISGRPGWCQVVGPDPASDRSVLITTLPLQS